MIHPVLATSVLVPLAVAAVSGNDAPVRIRLSDNVYVSGDRARVNVRTEKDGYLVVLRVDTEGRVRVLFPVDPGSSASVRGGREIELRGRGGREAFTVTEKDGAGMVFAARSDTPFNFAPFMTGQHWNLESLVPADSQPDPETAMVKLVDRMGDWHYDYDAVPYKVDAKAYRRPGYGDGYGPGYPVFYDPWYPPLYRGYGMFGGFYSSWPWLYGGGFGMRTTIVVPIRAFHGRRR